MLSDKRYVNHIGEVIELNKPPYFLMENSLRDYDYEVKDNGIKITQINRLKGIVSKSIKIKVLASNKQGRINAINSLYEIIEKDVSTKEKGKLYIGDYYISCFITASTKDDFNINPLRAVLSLTLTTDEPKWVKEQTVAFNGSAYAPGSEGDLDYPHDYAYDYIAVGGASEICNSSITECNSIIRIYGAATNPTVSIGGNQYQVNCTVATGEILEINSKDRTINLLSVDGEKTNEFDNRNKENNIFAKIPVGESGVTWSHGFDFDVTLIYERGEPEWI